MARGGVAQLGERLLCTQEVVGSTPVASTIILPEKKRNESRRKILPGRASQRAGQEGSFEAPLPCLWKDLWSSRMG